VKDIITRGLQLIILGSGVLKVHDARTWAIEVVVGNEKGIPLYTKAKQVLHWLVFIFLKSILGQYFDTS
jgi:hypothetical protein